MTEEEHIQTLHPIKGKKNKRIALSKYEFIKKHLILILGTKEFTHTELMEALYQMAKDEFDGGVQWYGTVVRQDLEARNLIIRTKTKPEKYKVNGIIPT
jgi:hypothetical protein